MKAPWTDFWKAQEASKRDGFWDRQEVCVALDRQVQSSDLETQGLFCVRQYTEEQVKADHRRDQAT